MAHDLGSDIGDDMDDLVPGWSSPDGAPRKQQRPPPETSAKRPRSPSLEAPGSGGGARLGGDDFADMLDDPVGKMHRRRRPRRRHHRRLNPAKTATLHLLARAGGFGPAAELGQL